MVVEKKKRKEKAKRRATGKEKAVQSGDWLDTKSKERKKSFT